jgi:hypothetical protein
MCFTGRTCDLFVVAWQVITNVVSDWFRVEFEYSRHTLHCVYVFVQGPPTFGSGCMSSGCVDYAVFAFNPATASQQLSMFL